MSADKIYHGGPILTIDNDFSTAEAVATKDGKIIAVGSLADVEAHRGPDTQDVDLGGNTMMPGFVEAHGHPTMEMTMIGPNSLDIRATVCFTAEEVMRRLKERIAAAKPGEWLVAFGWDPLMLPDLPLMSSDFLTELCPNNALSVMHNSAHGSWSNKLAMEALGFDRDTPDPTGSEYCRDENGDLTGEAKEIPACFNLMGPSYQVTPETFESFILNEMKRFNSAGVTTTGDLGLYKNGMFEPTLEFAKTGKATLRIRAYEMSDKTLESPRKPGMGDGDAGWFRQIGIKIWADGSPWIGNVNTSFPYLDSEYTKIIGLKAGHKGGANYTREQLTDIVASYFTKQGFQLACHAHGDVVIDMVLDVYEEQIKASGNNDARLRLEHCGSMTAAQFKRAKELGVYCSLFPAHIYYWGDILTQFFGQRGEEWVNVKGALDAEHEFSFHNDSPVTPGLPLLNIQAAVRRKDYKGGEHAPELRIDIKSALRAQTIWAAKQIFSEDEVGSLEVGKFADFVILGANPLEVDPDTLKDVKIVHTISHDRIAYSS